MTWLLRVAYTIEMLHTSLGTDVMYWYWYCRFECASNFGVKAHDTNATAMAAV